MGFFLENRGPKDPKSIFWDWCGGQTLVQLLRSCLYFHLMDLEEELSLEVLLRFR